MSKVNEKVSTDGNQYSLDMLTYIRKHYDVDAQLNVLVRFQGGKVGRIVGARGTYLLVQFADGPPLPLHPTWKVEYLEGDSYHVKFTESETIEHGPQSPWVELNPWHTDGIPEWKPNRVVLCQVRTGNGSMYTVYHAMISGITLDGIWVNASPSLTHYEKELTRIMQGHASVDILRWRDLGEVWSADAREADEAEAKERLNLAQAMQSPEQEALEIARRFNQEPPCRT